jgi:hypothetical protein
MLERHCVIVEKNEICVRGMLTRMVNIQDGKVCPFPTVECGGKGDESDVEVEEAGVAADPSADYATEASSDESDE